MITTYSPGEYSKPLTVSERLIGSSSTGHQIFIWIRDRSSLWSMLKLMPLDSVARYSLTGMVTSPNWMAPFHIARATAQPQLRSR